MNAMPDEWYQRLEKITGKPAPDVGDIPELVALYAAMYTDALDDVEDEGELIERWVVCQIGLPAISLLIALASAEKPEERGAALYLLSLFGHANDRDIIVNAARVALNDESEIVQQSAQITLSMMHEHKTDDPC
jgi:hypothetical protein